MWALSSQPLYCKSIDTCILHHNKTSKTFVQTLTSSTWYLELEFFFNQTLKPSLLSSPTHPNGFRHQSLNPKPLRSLETLPRCPLSKSPQTHFHHLCFMEGKHSLNPCWLRSPFLCGWDSFGPSYNSYDQWNYNPQPCLQPVVSPRSTPFWDLWVPFPHPLPPLSLKQPLPVGISISSRINLNPFPRVLKPFSEFMQAVKGVTDLLAS